MIVVLKLTKIAILFFGGFALGGKLQFLLTFFVVAKVQLTLLFQNFVQKGQNSKLAEDFLTRIRPLESGPNASFFPQLHSPFAQSFLSKWVKLGPSNALSRSSN